MTESNDSIPGTNKASLWLQKGVTAGLLGGVFFLPLSLGIAAVLLLSAGIMLAARMLWSGEIFLRRTALDLWLAGFAVAAAASAPGSIFAYESWYNFYHLFSLYILVYLLVTHTVYTEQDGKRLVASILISAAVVCAYGLFQYFAGVDVTAERWIDSEQFPGLKTRIFSTLGNPNVLASFLVMSTGLAAGWATGMKHRRGRWALAMLAAVSAGCIILTYSRGAWLAVGAMVLILAWFMKRPGWRLLLGGLLALVALGLFVQDLLVARMMSILGIFNSADSSVALRWALWESTLAMVQEQPWLGIGWGTYPYVYPYYDFFVRNESVIIYHAHNTLLNLAAEVGICGMLCFAIAWGLALWKMLRSVMQAKEGGDGFRLGILMAFSGTAAFSMTDHVLFNIQVMAIFSVLLALTESLPEGRSEKSLRNWVSKKNTGLAGFFAMQANK